MYRYSCKYFDDNGIEQNVQGTSETLEDIVKMFENRQIIELDISRLVNNRQ